MFVFERDYDWKGLIAASGPAGREWVDTYRNETGEIHALIKGSAAALRGQQLDESAGLLAQAESLRREFQGRRPSLFHIVGRFYYGGLAYAFYRRGDFDLADQALTEAGGSLQAALELEPCLLPFAAISLDLPLKRARMARTRLDWAEMRRHSAVLREAIADQRPLCVLHGRDPVYHSTLADHLEAAPRLSAELAPGLRYLQDRGLREEVGIQMLGQLYLQPSLLIPYP